jgi:hypothetical protein
MKIKMTKKGMERWCQDHEVELLQSAGWSVDNKVEAEEIIVLKPPVKSKGTAKQTLDNANQQGDE